MTLNVDCRHKLAEHRHGTNACYVLDRCRCDPCRDARRAADRRRQRYNAGVGDHPLVDARPAFEHVESLIAQGMGRKRIAEVSGVPHGSLSKLIYGDSKRNMGPTRRLRRETAEKLLACPLDLADGAKVDRAEYDKLLAELLARGWTKTAIATHLAGKPRAALQVGRQGDVSAGNVRKLRQLLTEAVPLRYHGPTRRWVTPSGVRRHDPQNIVPTTPGAPPEPWQLPWLIHRALVAHLADREALLDEDRRRLGQAVRASIKAHGLSAHARQLAAAWQTRVAS